MSETYTISTSEVYSESDVKAVMRNTYEDIVGFANRNLTTYSQVKSWIEDLIYVLNRKVLKSFEIQLYDSLGNRFKSYKYEVNTAGFFSSGSASGGINYFDIPTGTIISLFCELDNSKPNVEAVRKVLIEDRNWGTNGSAMKGNSSFGRSYASGTLQLNRYEITK